MLSRQRRPFSSAPARLTAAVALAICLPFGAASGQVRLNEILAATNGRLLAADASGRLRPGTGPDWLDQGYSAPGWVLGTAPLGFGGASGLGTNVLSLMRNRTPNLYLRRSVTLTAAEASNEGQLSLRVRFDDGFIAWINGKEVARANTGPAGHFIYHDQKAYNFAAATSDAAYTPAGQPGTAVTQPVTFALGPMTGWLREGENILAIQLVNREPDKSARIDAQLEVVKGAARIALAGFDFENDNPAARLHRNLGGTVTNTTEGTPTPGSWLAQSPLPVSSPAWTDLSVRESLEPDVGIAKSHGLRLAYSQTGADQPAAISGPGLPLSPQIATGQLTEADLPNLRLSFKFRATPGAEYDMRLEAVPGVKASSLTGLPVLNATAGTAAAESAMVDFANSEGGSRTRTVSVNGTAANTTSGTVRNSFTLFTGAAMRGAEFRVTENNAAGAGGGGSTGALAFQVVTPPTELDYFGFYFQSVQVRSWTGGKVTAAQLRAGAMEFDYQLPPGAAWEVYIEPASGNPAYGDRLALGTITGDGSWRHATLETGAAENQEAFLAWLNTLTTTSMRLAFRCGSALAAGSTLSVDNVVYNPWRTWSATLSESVNGAPFTAAVNALGIPQFYPVFEKNGRALAPESAVVIMDDFSLTLTKPDAGTPASLVAFAAPGWSYFPGLAEPAGGLVETADLIPIIGSGEYADWVELLNSPASEADISGWSLSDSASDPRKFVFPANTLIPAGGALVVLTDGRAAPAGAVWLHAPFSLSADGETVRLFDAAGAQVDSVQYPPQDSFHSYGRDPAGSQWGFLRQSTPGQPNAGVWHAAQAEPPTFSPPGGFQTGTVSLTLASPTPGAVIRYTSNGTEPTETNGTPASGPLTLSAVSDRIGHVIRARTFAPGLLPSSSVTNTYLINQNANLRKNPAVLLSGDPGTTFYKPLGILAIQGGTYTDSQWRASQRTDYNIPVGDGRLTDKESSSRPYERPVFLEFAFPDGRKGIRENAGLRVSSSPYSRPRLVLSDSPSTVPWPADPTRKPSLNVFFRRDYGNASITFPLIPETEVRHFEEFRLRAGKNDISNPFIRDEFCRRLWTDMGNEGTVGTFTSVYLNGYYKGYFNLVERIREPFMQSHHKSSAKWDVNYINTFEDGDDVHWRTVLQPRLNANLTVKNNWDRLREVLDVENVADYIVLNVWAAMWDWPHNNWAMARERGTTGLWRCYVWDAEGGLNMGGHGPTYQTLRDDLLSTGGTTPVPTLFRRLMTSPEFRLLFADRVQRHLFNDGALTDARTKQRRTDTQAEVTPLMQLSGTAPDVSWYNNWTNASNGRRRYIFPYREVGQAGYQNGQFRDPNQDNNLADTLWPLTTPPSFSQHGGQVPSGFLLTITHSAPEGSPVYFTTDGSDPRVWGGTPSPTAQTYASPIALAGSAVTVRTRVRNALTNEWSPLTGALFQVATVPPSAVNLVVDEIMYHPPDASTAEATAGFTDPEEFEYIVLRNIGTAPVSLSGLRFSAGITFNFNTAAKQVIDPGQRLVIAKNAAALRVRYGLGIDAVLAGEYFGNLANSGELILLDLSSDGTVVKNFNFSDGPGWPQAADGRGSSLLLVNPGSNPDANLPTSWTASPPGGTPVIGIIGPTYAEWASAVFTPTQLGDPTRTGPDGDFDNDGWPNVMEFLLGTTPTDSAAFPSLAWSATAAADGGRTLNMSFPRLPTTGYAVQVQSSANLSDWQADLNLIQSTPLPDGSHLETWQKSIPAGTSRQFLRLQAVSAG